MVDCRFQNKVTQIGVPLVCSVRHKKEGNRTIGRVNIIMAEIHKTRMPYMTSKDIEGNGKTDSVQSGTLQRNYDDGHNVMTVKGARYLL